jgi:hypothetical protein
MNWKKEVGNNEEKYRNIKRDKERNRRNTKKEKIAI